jgi:elongation factor Ts
MAISASQVKELRDRTNISMMECKSALEETCGDVEKAIDLLRKKGIAKAAKKAGRTASEGQVGSYIHHGGKLGVLIEVNCETDFVSRTNDFQALVKDLAMHVAAANPLYVCREEIPPEVIEKEREIYKDQAASTGKPAKVIEKIIEGKLEKYFQEVCLLEQTFIKDDTKNIQALIQEKIALLGENILVKRFRRFLLGEGA